MRKDYKVCIAGGHGMVGTNIVRRFIADGYNFAATADVGIDLRNADDFKAFLSGDHFEVVVLTAAAHGGIDAYAKSPVEFLNNNIQISSSVINEAYNAGVKKIINIGASCVYNDDPNAVVNEDLYDKQPVQKATEPYGLAKLISMKLCEYYNHEYGVQYISLLPVNLYGDGSGYKLDYSSVLPSMLKRFDEAKNDKSPSVSIWGDGKNFREFLHVDDLIKAIEILINLEDIPFSVFNIGGYERLSINELSRLVADVVGYKGLIINDLSKPNGSNRGILDDTRIRKLGWTPRISMREGIEKLYDNYKNKDKR